MSKPLSRIACCALAVCASGCSSVVSVHAYVEEGHDKADFRELQPRNPPTPVHLTVEFNVNGAPHAEGQATAFNEVVRTLRRTGVMVPVEDPAAAAALDVNIDDQYDKSAASHNGWVSGLTLGTSGSTTRDEYHFSFTLTEPGAKPKTALYQQAMIILVGDAPPPGYGQAQEMEQAFSIIVKQSVLEFLHDQEGMDGGEPVMIVPDGK